MLHLRLRSRFKTLFQIKLLTALLYLTQIIGRDCLNERMNIQHTIGATLLPFELVVFSVSRPSGAKAHQLSCDVGETPLQTSGALLPEVTGDK